MVVQGKSKVEVKEILKDRLKKNRHGYGNYYLEGKSKVELDFSHRMDLGDVDSAYNLSGILVRAR